LPCCRCDPWRHGAGRGAAAGLAGPLAKGPHGFSEILYAFTSATANNGSAFAGLSAGTPFYNGLLGVAMWLGRLLRDRAGAGHRGQPGGQEAHARKRRVFPTTGPLWVGLLVGVILILGGLTFCPASRLARSPII
jgi:K+-transporting ATPase ATPase A chain